MRYVKEKEKQDARLEAGRKIVEEALKRDAVPLELAAKTIFRRSNVK